MTTPEIENMTPSEDDFFSVLSDFIKGKSGPEGVSMAKLSWDGPDPPTLPPRPKLSEIYAEFASEYPIVVSGLSRCSRFQTLALVGSMLTLPEFQANFYRLEVLVHLAALYANGKSRPTAAQVSAWFNQLGKGTCGRLEDPAEDVFLSNVYFGTSNYRLFEGAAEGNAFHTQIFLKILDDMPDTGDFESLKRSVHALLRLSEEIASRAKLPRNVMGNPAPVSEIQKPKSEVLVKLRKRVVFSQEDLLSFGIQLVELEPFLLSSDDLAKLKDYRPGYSPLEFNPIVQAKNKIVVSLPTTIGIAIRAFVMEGCIKRSMGNLLETSFANAYTLLFANERLFGELRNPPIRMIDYGDFHAAQMTIEVDPGRYLHLLFFVDGVVDYEKGAFLGVNPIDSISEFAEKSFETISKEFSSNPEFHEGLTIIIGCGWGRVLGLNSPEPKSDWRIEILPAYDVLTLGQHAGFEPLDLFRVLDGRDAIERMGVTLINPNGFLNLYAWMNGNEGHIVPHEKLEADFISDAHGALLSIPQNSNLNVRYDAVVACDIHLVRRPDGSHTLVRRVNGTPRYGTTSLSPFYADIDALNKRLIRSVFEGTRSQFWIEAHSSQELDLDTQYHLSNMVMNWSETIFRYIDTQNLDQGYRTFSCRVNFFDKSPPRVGGAIPSQDSIQRMIKVSIDKNAACATIDVGVGFMAASQRADNSSERAIVNALLKACLECVSSVDLIESIADLADKIIGDDGARHFHAFAVPDIRDFVRESLPDEGQIIEAMDDANSRLGLGWLVRDRSMGGEVEGRKECCNYLNKLIRAIAERIKINVARFDRAELIRKLLINHEALFAEAALWQRTFRAVRALSEDAELTTDTVTDKIAQFNAASLASRIIVEIALCESPLKGGALPGRYDIGILLADASQMFHFGGYSDAMYAEVMPAKIRISPAGDILMDHGFTDEIVRPFGRTFQSAALNNAAEKYSENYKEIEEEPSFNDVEPPVGEDAVFAAAWYDEFGFSIDNTRKFVRAFQNVAGERGDAVFLMPLPELLTYLVEDTELTDKIILKCLETFSLQHRPQWDRPPTDFIDSAWFPWRFRRQLSVVSRPIIQLADDSTSLCVLAPIMIVLHITKFVTDMRYGRFDKKMCRQGGALSKWIGKVNHHLGEAFNQKVADKFLQLGWNAQANLSDGQILNRKSDQKFGDVDVLAWATDHKSVLVIECKDLSFDKTFGEIARRLARYRGVEGADGKRDDLKKHLDRCAVMKKEQEALSKFVGFDVLNVQPMLIFSHPTPMQFHNVVGELGVEMLTFEDISGWSSSH